MWGWACWLVFRIKGARCGGKGKEKEKYGLLRMRLRVLSVSVSVTAHAAGRGPLLEVGCRTTYLTNHHVTIETPFSGHACSCASTSAFRSVHIFSYAAYYRRSKGYVRHEMTIHDINVEPVCAGGHCSGACWA